MITLEPILVDVELSTEEYDLDIDNGEELETDLDMRINVNRIEGGLPAGGDPGDILVKQTDDDYDADWEPTDVFIARYGETSYEDVLAAYNAGKALFCVEPSSRYRRVLPLYAYNANAKQFTFRTYYQGITWTYASLSQTNGWGYGTTYISLGNINSNGDIANSGVAIAPGDRLVINDESASRLNNSSVTFGNDSDKYLANDGTWQDIPVFVAIYEETTHAEILAAYDAGKAIFCYINYYGPKFLPLTGHDNYDSGYFGFSGVADDKGFVAVTVNDEDYWAVFTDPLGLRLIPAGGTPNQILAKRTNDDYAIKWINLPDDIFIAEYGTTLYADVNAAITAGKFVVVKYQDGFYNFWKYNSIASTYEFTGVNNSNSFFRITVNQNSAWAQSYTTVVPNSRKVNGKSLSSDITLDASDVGALPDSTVIPDDIFIAIYGTTSYADVLAAKNAGKLCFCKNDSAVAPLAFINTNIGTAYFRYLQGEAQVGIITVSSNNSWASTAINLVPASRAVNGKALSSNITLDASDVGALPDDTQIPQKTSDLQNDSGFLTLETDPTVPAWAKQQNKPSYTANEIGAVASNQGSGNAGKFLVVGNDGVVVPVTMSVWQGGNY